MSKAAWTAGPTGQLERLLGPRWEGLNGWRPVLKAMDHLAKLPPASYATQGALSASGTTRFPPCDVIGVPEGLVVQTLRGFADAHPILVSHEQASVLPDWPVAKDDDVPSGKTLVAGMPKSAFRYSKVAKAPFDNVFLDFTDLAGRPYPISSDMSVRDVGDVTVGIELYGALVMSQAQRPRVLDGVASMFTSGSLVIVPFGCAVDYRDQHLVPHHSKDLFMSPAAPVGFLHFGPKPPGVQKIGSSEVKLLLGSVRSDDATVRHPLLGMMHMVPLAWDVPNDFSAWAVVGIGAFTDHSFREIKEPRLGVWDVEQGSEAERGAVAEARLVSAQASEVLKVLYLLEAANVTLGEACVSRQVRRHRVAKSGGEVRIASTIKIVHRPSKPRREGPRGKANYSHSFDRMASYRHVTRGSHAKPEHLKPCPEWLQKHPHSELCRREHVPSVFVDAGEGKPYIPKIRTLG